MTPKKIVISLILILVLVGGFVAGVILLRDRQDIEEQAAVPGGDAEVSILPTSGSFDPGDTFPVSIYVNTANIAVNGIAVKMFYPYSGSTPEIRASNIEINPTLLSSGDWTCSTLDVSEEGGNVVIEISCGNVSSQGFSTNADTLLATMDLTVERVPQVNPTEIRFDPDESVIRQLSNGEDILLIPQSTATYTIAGGQTQPTATPTPESSPTATPTTEAGVTATPTATPTVTPTLAPSVTPTSSPTITATPTLMDSGFSYPTLMGLGLAVLVILGSLVLAL